MKNITISTLIVLMTFTANAHVALDTPLGGESFNPGDELVIKWHLIQSHTQNNWDLYYSVDAGATWVILALDLPNTQVSYAWTIPNIITSTAKVKIVQDNEGANYQDISNNFGIGTAVITAIEPKLPLKTSMEVYPNPFNNSTKFKIELTTPAKVMLNIYDTSGRSIYDNSASINSIGTHYIEWYPKNLPRGFYTYRININNKSNSGKLYYQ